MMFYLVNTSLGMIWSSAGWAFRVLTHFKALLDLPIVSILGGSGPSSIFGRSSHVDLQPMLQCSLVILFEQHEGWLPLAAMDKVAKIVGQEPMRVYEVATFYTMFNREKRGKYFIQLCGTTPCMVCGSEEIKKTIMDELGIENGGKNDDFRHKAGSNRLGAGYRQTVLTRPVLYLSWLFGTPHSRVPVQYHYTFGS